MLHCGFSAVALFVPEAPVSADFSDCHSQTAVSPASEPLTLLPYAGSTFLAQGPFTHITYSQVFTFDKVVTVSQKNPRGFSRRHINVKNYLALLL